MGGWDGVCEPCLYSSCELFSSNIECINDFNVWCILWLNPYVHNDWSCLDLCGMYFLEICINRQRSSQCVTRFYEAWHGNWPENMREREMMTLLLSNHSSYARGARLSSLRANHKRYWTLVQISKCAWVSINTGSDWIGFIDLYGGALSSWVLICQTRTF